MTLPWWFGGSSDAGPPGAGDVPRNGSRAHDTSEREDPADPVERAIVARIREGDEKTFEQLVRDHAPALARFAYDYLKAVDAAEELVNDVFVWVWEHRAAWSVSGTVRGYLFGAVRHRALNARRNAAYRERWVERYTGDRGAAGVGAAARDPEQAIETAELGAALRVAIDQLPEGRRTAVVLRWLHEMSYAEIAAIVGTSVVGVKQQLNRALRELRTTVPASLR